MLPLLSFSALFGVVTSAHASQNPICKVGGSLDELEPTEINMVVDDSGSMFLSKSNEQIRLWSYAKYSLEVFAALLRPNDILNVYLLSSYKKDGGAAKPVVTLYGNSPQGERVDAIRNMTLNGKGTPYGPVQDAYKDLVTSSAPEKWLVIMTDGKFDGVSNEQVSGEVAQYLNEGNVSSRSKLQIAFLSIGDEAPVLILAGNQIEPLIPCLHQPRQTPELHDGRFRQFRKIFPHQRQFHGGTHLIHPSTHRFRAPTAIAFTGPMSH